MENILLLHGALGSAATLEPLKQALQETFSVHTLDFSGHGGKALPQGGTFTMQLFVQDVLQHLEEQRIDSTHVFGYSMGGYAALSLALQQPQRFRSIYTLATKFAWSAEAAEEEVKLLNPDRVEEKVPAFAATLAKRHAPQSWKEVMRHTASMMRQLGQAPVLTAASLPSLQLPVQISVGDRDSMVSVEESLWAYRLLPNARLQVLPHTRHPLEKLDTQQLSQLIRQFVAQTTVNPTTVY